MIGIILFILTILFIALLYVAATYAFYSYDRHLARGQVFGKETNLFPPRTAPLRGLCLEVLATFTFICLYPIGYLMRKSPRKKSGSCPIILIHGLQHNQSAWLWIRFKLKKQGLGPIYTVNLNTARHTIEELAQNIATKAQIIEQETHHKEIILIGHSMGGVIATYYAVHLAPLGKVSHLVTLGSPLHGTRLAYMAYMSSIQEIRPNTPLIQELILKMTQPSVTIFAHVASSFDNMIFPSESAIVKEEGHENLILLNHGHLSLLFSPKIANQVITWITSPSK